MKWFLIYPELYYFAGGLIFLFLSLSKQCPPKRAFNTAIFLALLGVLVSLGSIRQQGDLLFQAYRVDLFSQVFKAALAIGLFLVVSICSDLEGVAERHHPEFYLLLYFCTLAMMLLVSSVHMLTIYVALELSSYSLYILVALRRDEKMGLEASLKYFLVGIFASAVMLFGIALLYSTTQALYMTDLMNALPGILNSPAGVIGMLLTLCGFFFKLAVFPFHFWAPDVYQGAANQVTAYIATASKVAAVAILTRMVAASGDGSLYLSHVLVVLSIVSMTVGNLAAIVQKDLKRLLAYSTVAHAGYVLIGILSMNSEGYAAAIFYAAALLIMKFTVFLVIVKVAAGGGNLEISQLTGLHRRAPLLAMALMVAIFSLAGIPPTIGFTGKFLVFTAAMQKGYFTLTLIAMINVVISLYYYLLILKAAYLLEPEEAYPQIELSASNKILTAGLVVVMVVVGIFPQHLIELTRSAAQMLH
jgi:NADH-quinone oxidoreductase subunit N